MAAYERSDELAKLISVKYDILQQLRELSRRQIEIVESTDMDRLLTVLAAKQLLLKDLQNVELQLDPFRPDDPELRQWRTANEREQCRQIAKRCEALLQEIMLMEKRCETVLTTRRDQVAARLDEAHGASEARRAYSEPHLPKRNRIDLSTQ